MHQPTNQRAYLPLQNRNKFGEHGMRIWRLLFVTGQLEQKQVREA